MRLHCKTYILIIDNDALTILDIDSIGGPNPTLPEDTINPSKPDLFSSCVIHINANRLGSPECSLVTTILSLLDSHLLRVTELLPFELEFLDLTVHPLVRSALHLAKSTLEVVLVVSVHNTENDDLTIHDLAGVRRGHFRDER